LARLIKDVEISKCTSSRSTAKFKVSSQNMVILKYNFLLFS
jgi:hypothetical protein